MEAYNRLQVPGSSLEDIVPRTRVEVPYPTAQVGAQLVQGLDELLE
ncbi:hypothetical protein [Dictyobacter aurantiacus]|uniref:Uncharacterized protein n=1 Tax=Dictyobacter aurantiacus TaxID=1936993 RepID=A0A401ZEI6_9CHLR|nr:hypothetical protein [Dictyobacter aurantiacus]GCE05291.1 hypothetical protein KDAU_26200 [Dictyobacter aurantiacus]